MSMKDGTMKTRRGLQACSALFSLTPLVYSQFNVLNCCRFKGSDDYLRTKFEEYISAALASVRYRDFMAKGEVNGVLITGGSGLFSKGYIVVVRVLIVLDIQAEMQTPQKTSTPCG
jgi:hypothetical protein